MTPEAINIAIAESCGIIAYEDCLRYGFLAKTGRAWNVPDYYNDLNAIHEVEKTLNERQCLFYMQRLSQVRYKAGVRGTIGTMLDRMVFATAPQRCEAYLRTIGKWKENEE